MKKKTIQELLLYIVLILVCLEAMPLKAATLLNVAAQANGGVASASSTYSVNYPVKSVNDGDRQGLNWGNGGGWNDATVYQYPDWVKINFAGAQSISEIDVFTLQDNYANPVNPTPTLTFSQLGITDFQVQYWDGAAWVTVTGGNVTGNNLVWQKFTFASVTVLICLPFTKMVNVEPNAWTAKVVVTPF